MIQNVNFCFLLVIIFSSFTVLNSFHLWNSFGVHQSNYLMTVMKTDNAVSTSPYISFWEVYTDLNGTSHQKRNHINNFILNTISQQQVNSLETIKDCLNSLHLYKSPIVGEDITMKMMFLILLPGVVHDWHENPFPQWIIPLSGKWFVETMDNVRVEMGPGELSFGGDQGCRQTLDGKFGHLSGVVGDEPCVLLLIQANNASDFISLTQLQSSQRWK